MTGKTTLLVIWAVVGFLSESALAQDKAEGRRIYLSYCSACHGETGKGDGLAAASMAVKPADHTNGEVMNKESDRFLYDIISKGGNVVQRSAMMPSWGGQLKDKQIRDVIAYIRTLAVPPYKPAK